MSALSASVAPLSILKPVATPASSAQAFNGMDEATKRAQIDVTAKQFEEGFLSIMFGQMFEGTGRSLFGGGEGEEAFSGFLTDAMAKEMEKHGGVGLARSLSAEMLKLQGLAQKLSPSAAPVRSSITGAPAAEGPATAAKPSLDIAA